MPSWKDLVEHVDSLPDDPARGAWLVEELTSRLTEVGQIRAGPNSTRNVIFYASAFLQKPNVPGEMVMIHPEDINGAMTVIHGMSYSRGLTLLLHTPGGVTNAAETLVAYLRSKFEDIEVIVPTYAMSAGTMIALASDRIVMGRQSQLGPIDPQIPLGGGRSSSARAVVETFERARAEVMQDQSAAHVWAPILATMGPSLLQDAQNALDYSERMVALWLSRWMFKSRRGKRRAGEQVAHHFNDASTHKSHGRRIDRTEARSQKLTIEDLEDDQALQEAVLTAYHLVTLLFEKSITTKLMFTDAGRQWIKNWAG